MRKENQDLMAIFVVLKGLPRAHDKLRYLVPCLNATSGDMGILWQGLKRRMRGKEVHF